MRKNLIKAHILSQNKPEPLQGHHDGQEHRSPLSRQHPKKPCPQQALTPRRCPQNRSSSRILLQKPPHTSSALLLMRTKCSLSASFSQHSERLRENIQNTALPSKHIPKNTPRAFPPSNSFSPIP
ncbi:hypothetical protein BH14320 [Bartonella henselae str. Houston-1]|uniref:Uncharacterized protein n=2 Tax=root TaxID=1 RepID=A0A0H3M458_BARHE|nr:hypothetical protein BH14320 [Bartonella henselae str. Houston-1]DBA12278.1 TPA_asm: hypothetical protein [Bartonegtaviriform andersoni]